jgi:uncharacterized protein YjbJ (UPF0337 family)
MKWEEVTDQMKQMGDQAKAQWAKLTDQDLKEITQKKDKLVSKIQERYGVIKDEAEKQVDEWMSKVKGHKGGDHPSPGQATQSAGQAAESAGQAVQQSIPKTQKQQ